jgi:hypothetical protein
MKIEPRARQTVWVIALSLTLFLGFQARSCPPGCFLFLSPISASFARAGIANYKVKVLTGNTCKWTSSTQDSWITITSEISGTGSGVITFSVSVNPGIPRTGTITIANRVFTVFQAGVTPPPFFITGITPSSGPVSGGTPVTIDGRGFLAGATVKIGDSSASVTSLTGQRIRATTGKASALGTYDVIVANPGGEVATLNHSFTYAQSVPFFISHIAPSSGSVSGETRVTIDGGGFLTGATVSIANSSASVISLADNRITATTGKASTPGTYDVIVSNPGGEVATLNHGFTYTQEDTPQHTSFFVGYIAPVSGPLTGGTAVSIQGNGFQAGASVKIGETAATVTSVARTEIKATTGVASTVGTYDVTVANPGGDIAVLPDAFTYLPTGQELFVPVVVSGTGLDGSFFTSEMTLTNRGSGDATVDFTYTSSTFTSRATDSLGPGQQKVVPDAVNYLGSLGIPIPTTGNQTGTLRVAFSGLSSSSDGGVTVRTTTEVPEGRAGLAYAGIPVSMALTNPSYIIGLRQDQSDRSNLAIQNAGSDSNSSIALRLTVFSGAANDLTPHVLPEQVLAPGKWAQFSGILVSNGLSLSQGYVRIERIRGTAPYYAYGVINDQANSDGSFVPPVEEQSLIGKTGLTLPAIVETSVFSSEVVACNWSATSKTLHFFYSGGALQLAGSTAHFDLVMNPGEQRIIANFVQWLREQTGSGIGPQGPSYVGPLFATVDQGEDVEGIFMGARTSTPGGGGEYGVFYAATPFGSASSTDAWLYSLRQDEENRTNVAIVNTGEGDGNPDTFDIELFDGEFGSKVSTVTGVTVGARRWLQIDSILGRYAPNIRQGYAQVIRTSGSNPFIAYAVINDGAHSGERSGDGSFIASTP